MLGDTTAIRHLARGLRDRADDVRREAGHLARRIEAVPWEGCAADAMREHARLRLTALAATALLHEEAADNLDRHAAAVDAAADALRHLPGVGLGVEIGAELLS